MFKRSLFFPYALGFVAALAFLALAGYSPAHADGTSGSGGVTSVKCVSGCQPAPGAVTDVNVTNSTLAVTQSGTWTIDSFTGIVGVAGDIASSASDSGNPVKIGGVYLSTLPTYTTGDRGNAILSRRGSLLTSFVDPYSGVAVNATMANADDLTQTDVGLMTVNKNYIFGGGTSWNRARSMVNAANTTGVGITAVGALAQFDDVSPTSITENNFGNLRMSANRALYGTIRDAAGNERGANVTSDNALKVDGSGVTQPVSGTVGVSGTVPVSGTFWQATQPVSGTVTATGPLTDTQLRAAAVPVSGTFYQATQPVSGTVAATQSGTWTVQPGNTANTTAWKVTGTGGTFPVTGTFWQATQPVSGPLTDTQLRATAVPVSGTVNVGTVTTLPALPTGTNTIGNTGFVTTTTGGASTHYAVMAASTNATNVKASAGQVYGVQVFNNSANIAYLKLYNTSSAPTCNSSTVVGEFMIPGNASGAGAVISIPYAKAFTTGISYCVTGGIAANDNTAVAASAFIVNIDYK